MAHISTKNVAPAKSSPVLRKSAIRALDSRGTMSHVHVYALKNALKTLDGTWTLLLANADHVMNLLKLANTLIHSSNGIHLTVDATAIGWTKTKEIGACHRTRSGTMTTASA